jgi:hypothetical protein
MKPPRHPKWKEASIAASIPGWQRFKAAEDWLKQHNMSPLPQTAEVQRMRFDRFLAERPANASSDPTTREALFREFMDWMKRNEFRR